ncbi:MAG TPA: nucleoside-diphosphate kinase, partial [Dehalococcoidia bacterium]|nr:nucleoside-diphosphate kinase [Dehalococcoidia bacterium]
MEKTLILVKPDGVQRGLVGEIVGRLERKGLRIAGLKMVQVNEELANKHYGEHVGKPFFDSLVKFITSSPLVAMALEGENAVEVA